MDLFKPINGTLHMIEIITQWCKHRHWGGGGTKGGGGLLNVAHGGLAWVDLLGHWHIAY